MGHLDTMLACLPQLYRDGELVRTLLEQPAQQLEIIDEQARLLARRRLFDATYEREDAVKSAALLGIDEWPWQSLEEFRAWVHSLRNALLRQTGSVTIAGLQNFIGEYVERFERANAIRAVAASPGWSARPGAAASFVENPLLRRVVHAADEAVAPLHRFVIDNAGLDEATLRLLVRTTAALPEYMPCIANLTTGQALVFRGALAAGQRLWIDVTPQDTARATCENRDESDRLFSIDPFEAGVAFTMEQQTRPAKPLKLARGRNEMWFFIAALYDEPGLDRVLLAAPGQQTTQGNFDASLFDRALFEQEKRVCISVAFDQAQPAAFNVTLDAGCLLHAPGAQEHAVHKRALLESSLDQGVRRLAAAGVRPGVRLAAFCETMHQRDCLRETIPRTFSDAGSCGADRAPVAGALFEKTGFNQSIFH